MKSLLKYLFVFCCLNSNGQIINTVAGNGFDGDTGDAGQATAAEIGEPDGCAFDKNGNLYFTTVSPNQVRKVTPGGIISTIAGTIAGGGYNVDGISATSAQLSQPSGIAIDRFNNVFIADGVENRVRRVDAITGIISTIAGNGTFGYGGDGGPATASILNSPEDICFDKIGNLYIADYNNFRIRKIDTFGIITTVVGNGIEGFSGSGGMATNAMIETIAGVCTDLKGNLYITDNNGLNIRMISTNGIITNFAGNGFVGPTGDGGQATAASIGALRLAFDEYENLYISGGAENLIRVIDRFGIIHTVAGTGVYGFTGDGGSATSAEISNTYGVTVDTCGNVYIADKDNVRIRKIAMNPMCLNLGINNQNVGQPITIYPNPTFDQLNLDNLKTRSTYRFLNILGTMEQRGELKEGNNSIPMLELTKGMYLLEITDEEGNKTVKKIMKE